MKKVLEKGINVLLAGLVVSMAVIGVNYVKPVSEGMVWNIIVLGAMLVMILSMVVFLVIGIVYGFNILRRGFLNIAKYNGKGDFSEIDKFIGSYKENTDR